MGVVVTFSYDTWTATFPEFLSAGGTIPVTPTQAAQYFTQATMLHANDGSGPVNNSDQQLALLNMVTAHIAAIFAPPQGQAAASPIVGRIKDATQGSVSVSAENDYPPGSAQYWQQTKYGSMYWEATKQFRRMRYYPNPRSPVTNPWQFPGWGGF